MPKPDVLSAYAGGSAPVGKVLDAKPMLRAGTVRARRKSVMTLKPDIKLAAPTDSEIPFRPADFTTFVEALAYAATGKSGFTYYNARGEILETLTYERLARDSANVAARLLSAGLNIGDRVAIVAETEADFARTFCGALLAGLVPAPLPLPVAFGAREAYNDQLRRIVAVAGARAVFAPTEYERWVAEAMADVDLLFCGRLDALPEATGNPTPAAVDPEALAYLQFSSGTTGSPKGVAVTHSAMMANLAAISAHGLHFAAGDRGVSWLPLYHDMGLVGCFLSPIANQFSADLLSTKDFVRRPLMWLELIDRNRATVTYAPSFGYDLAQRRTRGTAPEGLDLSTWRIAGIGGDMIKAPIIRAFSETFGNAGFRPEAFTPSYGMAETTLALSFAPIGQGLVTERLDLDALERDMAARTVAMNASRAARDFAYCGPALPGHEIEIRNPDGAPLPEGSVGRIFAAGPSLMSEYYGDPIATSEHLNDGWLDTGDLGFLRDGQIVITGRAKDLMIIHGRNLWPQDIEWTVEQIVDHVREGGVAAFAVTPDDSGARIEEEVVIVAECRLRDAGERADFREAVHHAARTTHGVEVRVVLAKNGALPRTSSGKLSRAKTRLMYLDGQFDPAPHPAKTGA